MLSDWANQPWKKAYPSVKSTPKRDFRDANGNILKDGDEVVLVKAITIKGSTKTVKVGTKIKNIFVQDAEYPITCKIEGFGTVRLKMDFVKKV